LVEYWDGAAWTINTSPNTDVAQENRLFGVTCASATDCWAIGRYFTGLILQTLIEHWDGTGWTIATSPDTSIAEENYLYDVTCSSTLDCWTVGAYGSGSGTGQPLIEHWDGTSWTIVPSPKPTDNPQYNYNFLRGVTCPSASACWTVGYSFADGAYRTLIERWDGTAWTIATSPNTSATQYNYLFGVTCVSTSDCWATGYHNDDGGILQTLTEHYTASLPPIPTNVISRKTHGSVGDFDVDLPLIGNPGIECRSGPVSGNHRVIVTFASAVTVTDATVTPGQNGTASLQLVPGANHAEVLIDLSNVSNAQTLTINLLGVSDGTNSGDLHIPMAVLLGDVDASKRTDAGDVTQVRNRTVSLPDQQTFRFDVNASGRIDAGDVTVTRNASVTVLP
jgi:hypothetical protein